MVEVEPQEIMAARRNEILENYDKRSVLYSFDELLAATCKEE
jgi:hypothetical protein